MATVAEPRRRLPCLPAVPVALAAAAGIAADRFGPQASTTTWAAVAGVAAVLGLLTWRWPGASIPALLVAFAALGGGWHHRRWSDLEPDDLARGDWETPRPAWLRGVLDEVPEFRAGDRPGESGTTWTVLAVEAISDGRRWQRASGRVQVAVSGDRTALRAGEPVMAAGTLAAVPGPLNPGEFDRRIPLRAEGIRLRLAVGEPTGLWPDPGGRRGSWRRWLGVARAWSYDRLVRGLDSGAAPLAAALLLGRREAVDPEVNDAFARTGTTHLLAISGLHMQALAAALWLVLRVAGLGRKSSLAAIILATVAYTLLVGSMPSVVRSAAMTVMACLAGLVDRYARPANLLAQAALATLIVNPAHLFDVGCQLSFLAVAAMVWGVPPVARRLGLEVAEAGFRPFAESAIEHEEADPLDALERRLEPAWKKGARRLAAGLAHGVLISTVVWLAALPLVALRFHLVSPVGVLLNVPLIPLTSLALLAAGLSLGLSAVWAPLGWPVAWACARLLGYTEAIVRWGAAQRWGHAFVAGPTWPWVLGFYALLALASLAQMARHRLRRPAWVALGVEATLGLLVAAQPMRPGALEAEVLAVGHGLAVIVQAPDGRAALYDCGQLGSPHVGRRVIAPALWSRRIHRLDMAIISHADADHYDGLPDLLDRFRVGAVCVPPGFAGPANPGAARLLDLVRARGVPIRTIVAGGRLDLGPGADLAVLHPPDGWQPDAPDNARCLVLDLAGGGRHFLLTGDLEGIGFASLLAYPPRRFDAMLAPHHGGRSANPARLYRWARPALVVVSQRRPAAGARDPLPSAVGSSTPILRTWQSGAIRLRWDASGLGTLAFVDRNRDRSPTGDDPSTASPPWLSAVVAIVGLASGLALCGAWAVVEWGAWALVRPGRRLGPTTPEPAPWEPIEVRAADGIILRGAWRGADGARGRTAVLLHGFAEDRSALLGRAEALAARGWNVALLDARGRGLSDGLFTTFGTLEADDLRRWIDALAARVGPGLSLVAWGRSMGATIALRAAADDPRLLALVLEAPYLDLKGSVASWLRRARLPRFLAGPILLRARLLADVPLDHPPPITFAPRVRVPALVLHGTDDRVVPPDTVRRLASSLAGPVEVVEIAGARHGDVFDVGGAELAERIVAFLDEAAAPSPKA
jgi:competence protein ComEC